jgi:hypothetical protein
MQHHEPSERPIPEYEPEEYSTFGGNLTSPRLRRAKNPPLREDTLDKLDECLFRTSMAQSQAACALLGCLLAEFGGLPASLAYDVGQALRKPAMLFLLSVWIVPENITKADGEFVIAKGTDPQEERRGKMAAALEGILEDEGLTPEQREEWLDACRHTLSADINTTSALVNRKASATAAAKGRGLAGAGTDGAMDIIGRFYGGIGNLLGLFVPKEFNPAHDNTNCSIVCDTLFSNRFGKGQGADFGKLSEVYSEIAAWARSWPVSQNVVEGTPATVTDAGPTLDMLIGHLSRSGLLPPEGDAVPGFKELLLFLKKNSHKSKLTTLLGPLGNDGTDSPLGPEKLGKLATAAQESSAKCLASAAGKGPMEYLTSMMHAASAASGVPFETSGHTVRFFKCAMTEAVQRFKSRMSLTGRREGERESMLAKGNAMLGKANPRTVAILDGFRAVRKEETGASEEYEIRKGAIKGYAQLHGTWAAKNCGTVAERLEALERFWEEAPDGRKGDISLFRYLCGRPPLPDGPDGGFDPLTDASPADLWAYVEARKNFCNASKWKIHMLRHFDPFRSPATLRFGSGRMNVVHDAKKHHKGPFFQYLQLALWDGGAFVDRLGHWDSKLINEALSLRSCALGPEAPLATRNFKLAAGLDPDTPCQVHDLYTGRDNWAVTISMTGESLGKLRALKNPDDLDAKSLGRIRKCVAWHIDFHIKFRPYGPYHRFASKTNEGPEAAAAGTVCPAALPKRGREASIDPGWDLSGVKALGVDIGRNNAIALAFLHPTATSDLEALCLANHVPCPGAGDKWCHVPVAGTDGGATGNKTIIFQRIGPDILPDGTKKPTPWARIGVQSLPKIRGESPKEQRELSDDEMVALHNAEVSLGIPDPYVMRLVSSGFGQDDRPPNQKDRLSRILRHPSLLPAPPAQPADVRAPSPASVLRTAIVAANGLVLTVRQAVKHFFWLSGIPALLKDESPSKVAIGLQDWWDLMRHGNKDVSTLAATDLWDRHVRPLPGYRDPGPDRAKGAARKASGPHDPGLEAIARSLMEAGAGEACRHFEEALEGIEASLAEATHTAHRFLFPDRRRDKKDRLSGRMMGGLSQLRIDAMGTLVHGVMRPLALYRANKPAEGGVANGSPEFDITTVCKPEIATMQRIRGQRANEIVSAVLKAALGESVKKKAKGAKGKNGKPDGGPGAGDGKLCPFVIVENLDSLTPSSDRTRRENRIISTMRAGGITTKLKERCRRLGLMLVEVDPAETSVIDSRTNNFGIRLMGITAAKFMSERWIRGKVAGAARPAENDEAEAENRLWRAADESLRDLSVDELAKAANLFVPSKGGKLFLSADEKTTGIIHADINAACNIGLRGLTTPGWVGGYHKVLVDGGNVPDKTKYARHPAVPTDRPLIEGCQGESPGGKRPAGKNERSNLFRTPSCDPVDSKTPWLKRKAFFKKVREGSVNNLIKRRGLGKPVRPDDP